MQGIELAKQLAWSVLLDQGHTFESACQELPYFYSGTRGVDSDVFVSAAQIDINDLYNHQVLSDAEQRFLPWLQSSKHNSIQGLEYFDPSFSAGVTQALDSFLMYAAASKRTVALLEGEYFYAPVVCNNLGIKYKYISDSTRLHPGDALIISYPFADTGSRHPKMDSILEACSEFNIPVMIDACYWMLGKGLELDVTSNCIKTVAFSFSKAYPVAHARAGIRYTRPGFKDGQTLHRDIGYNNRLSASIANTVMSNYSPDYLVDKYWDQYIQLCKMLDLAPQNSVLFATGNSDWREYSRATLAKMYGLQDNQRYNNRIFLGRLLESEIIDEITTEILQHQQS